MGCYDSVFVNCPQCKRRVEFQTKAGACELKKYDAGCVPPELARSLHKKTEVCKCGAKVQLRLYGPILRVPMRVKHVRAGSSDG